MTNKIPPTPEEKLVISSISAFIELSGGQPLDRWKINLQLPIEDRISTKKIFMRGPKEWYVASTTSIIQRCFFYIPTIYLASDIWIKNFHSDTPSNKLLHAAFVSSIITPGVSWFENMKTEQQIGNNRNKSMAKLTKIHYLKYGIGGVIPSLQATFLRESAFCGGICCITPIIHNKIKQYDYCNTNLNWAISGAMAGLITQLISQPFDTIKTRQEKTKMGFIPTYKNIYMQGGFLELWKGSIPRCIRGIWTLSILSVCNNYLSQLLQSTR